jgi:hypothetical protein
MCTKMNYISTQIILLVDDGIHASFTYVDRLCNGVDQELNDFCYEHQNYHHSKWFCSYNH